MSSVVLDGGDQVGRMTAGTHSHTLDCGVGYVRFKEPGDWSGRSLSLKFADGKVHPCEIVELPFFDKNKEIVRGIDKTIP